MKRKHSNRSLFVIWQDAETRRWLPVARLTKEADGFRFTYTKGAEASAMFTPFGAMKDLKQVYRSTELFPLFANRVIAVSRPEYPKVMRWLGLTEAWDDGFEILARSGGERKTDTLRLVPKPEKTWNDRYELRFFSHGIRYLSQNDQICLRQCPIGERLFMMHDMQNPKDPGAVLLRTGDPMSFAGYCPRYLADDFLKLAAASDSPHDIAVTIEQINDDAPPAMQVLCKLDAPWPAGFEPFAAAEFEPVGETAMNHGSDKAIANA